MRNLLVVGIIIVLAVMWYNASQKTHKQVANPDSTTNSAATPEEDISSPVVSTDSRTLLTTDGTLHSIPLEEIRQGCFGRDCIPSVDNPKFISAEEASKILTDNDFGIGLNFDGEQRFYSFNMLVTREIVNDTVAGIPLAVTYCPLCGTGIVFDRTVNGVTFEFGVSGFLWQSNLLMYNRTQDSAETTLWSQVLGEGVVGPLTGTVLPIVPSTISTYGAWRDTHPTTLVLDTGRIGDPYNGDYFSVAENFDPNFDSDESPLAPTEYVFGIEVNDIFKAYPREALPTGTTNDTLGGTSITITKDTLGGVSVVTTDNKPVSHIEGFWFSWFAAHPETLLWGQ